MDDGHGDSVLRDASLAITDADERQRLSGHREMSTPPPRFGSGIRAAVPNWLVWPSGIGLAGYFFATDSVVFGVSMIVAVIVDWLRHVNADSRRRRDE